MRLKLIVSLASAFFKSYFRASSQRASASFFSKPKVMLAIDVALFLVPALVLQFAVPAIPPGINAILTPIMVQAMISLPLLITGAVIIAGLMFELGQGSAIFSSEAVNWWPVSPREYVAASSLSTSTFYSIFLALSAGLTLPLAIKLDLLYLWPTMIVLSIFALFLGSFIVESLKAVMNRISAAAYKKSGRLTLAIRLVALIILFSIVQLAFQPVVLSWVFAAIVSGIELVWVLPFVWSSTAMLSLFRLDAVQTVLFSAASILFTLVFYEVASQLRSRYWSPVPISISIDESTEYIPQGSIGKGFGFNSLASQLALKEFRALTRRKDLARFIAVPIVIAVSVLAPIIASPGDMTGRGPGFFLAALIPYMVPLLFASVSIGLEGNSITHLLCLPVKVNDLIKGKLAPAILITSAITFPVIALMESFAPLGLGNTASIMVVALLAIVINSLIGLGAGSRWPDFTVGARSRFLSSKGYLMAYVLCGLATLALYFPVGLYVVTSGGVRGEVASWGLTLLPMLAVSTAIGCALMASSYIYCRRGVRNLLSNVS